MEKTNKSEKHKKILLEQIKEKDIIDEEMGTDRYLALTKDTLYFVSMGAESGAYFSNKVKAFPIDTITSIEVNKSLLMSSLFVTAAGIGGSTIAGANRWTYNDNRIFFRTKNIERFQEIAQRIRDLMKKNKEGDFSKDSTADEIEKLHSLMKKGIITKKEFEEKKKKLLS